jgi:hypothetical protein
LGAYLIRQVNAYWLCYCNLLRRSTNVNKEIQLTLIRNKIEAILFDVCFVDDKRDVKNSWTFVFTRQVLKYLMRYDVLVEYDARKTSVIY